MRNKTLVLKIVGLVALMALAMSFNWDRIEMEARAYVIALGVDKADDGGFLAYMSVIDAVALEKGGGDAPKTLHEGSGKSLACAMADVGTKMNEDVYFGHTKAIVLGQKLLEAPEMLAEVIGTLAHQNDLNIQTIVTASNLPAGEILQHKPDSESLLGIYLSKLPENTIQTDLEGLTHALKANQATLITKLTLLDEKINVGGVAIIKNGKLAGYANDADMAGYKWLTNAAVGERIFTQDGTVKITNVKTKITFSEEDGIAICKVNVKAAATLETSGAFSSKKLEEMQKEFEQKIEEEILNVFELFQDEYHIEALGLIEHMRKHHPNIYKTHAQKSEQIKIFPNVSVKIQNGALVK